MKKLNIVADENIPALDAYYGHFASIKSLPGRLITADDLTDADVLIVRSVTQVNEALLQFSSVKFVGTCTIGTDHIDLEYLQRHGIGFSSAPGCNADAVVDYVLSCILTRFKQIEVIQQMTVGVLGYGQVGRRLVSALKRLDIAVLCYDPFVDEADATFDEIVACDIISIHTPITYIRQSAYPTFHLFNRVVLDALKPSTLLINAARGKVIDNGALLQHLKEHEVTLDVVLDVYEDEPTPSLELLSAIYLTTSHIAGYSVQGKLRGTSMIAQALCAYFDLSIQADTLLTSTKRLLNVSGVQTLSDLILTAYNVPADSEAFQEHYRQALKCDENGDKSLDKALASALFDEYRKDYAQRHEFGFTLLQGLRPELKEPAELLGFLVQ